jgi:hypothetical protein
MQPQVAQFQYETFHLCNRLVSQCQPPLHHTAKTKASTIEQCILFFEGGRRKMDEPAMMCQDLLAETRHRHLLSMTCDDGEVAILNDQRCDVTDRCPTR